MPLVLKCCKTQVQKYSDLQNLRMSSQSDLYKITHVFMNQMLPCDDYF